MDMPKPQEQHRKLQSLAGTWTGEEKMHPSAWDPKGGQAKGRFESRLDLDGFFLTSDYVQERSGQVTYRGHGVFGYDPSERCYTMHWFDSMGSPCATPARGTWVGNRLMFLQRTPMGHARYTYTFEEEGRYSFMMENSQDGERWAPMMEGKYSRKG